ncbi:CMRF35-like molecule 5 isoform X2 [Notolabrus celidotus]|uniref:CMRF35-like molecule 5 isoform X2 n=1 Tax=Notolabrus celidotus TaxID=1203425 RepID=UPI00148FA362|nr:CMRF35-like molecule 5 isoform X2 [Notolabrus celidotus]
MMKIHVYTCLLSVLTLVEMKTINTNGRVGSNLIIKCSHWNLWGYEKENVKYFCGSPCNDKDVIVKAEYRKTRRKNQIELTNSGNYLFVTFLNLQKSDSGKYYCGLERFGRDPLIEVNVEVKDAEPSSPLKTPNPVFVTDTTSPSTSTNVPTVFTDMSYLTTSSASATQGAGSAFYWTVGSIGVISLLIVVLILTKRMMMKQQEDVTTPQEPARKSGDPDGVYQSLNPFTADTDQVYSTIGSTN